MLDQVLYVTILYSQRENLEEHFLIPTFPI